MISPELLRHYPFFGSLNDSQLRELAMIAEAENYDAGTILFHEGGPADYLYFLVDGSVDLYYASKTFRTGGKPDGIPVGEINPGEPFSISALIEPHVLTSTGYISQPSRIIHISATELRNLFKQDKALDYEMTLQAAKVVISRLHSTRIQLAAAWA